MKQPVLKKWIPILLAVFLIVCSTIHFPTVTYAAGVSVTPSSNTVNVGDSVTVTVTLYGSEIYAYSGYIDCDDNLSGDTGGFAEGADGENSVSLTFTYYAVGEGSASIYVSDCEVSDGSDKEYAGEAVCTINVVGYDNGGGGTGGNAGGTDYEDYDEINGYDIGEGSDNTNLATLEVEGYTLVDEGYDVYSVSVSNSVKKINIIAVPEDETSFVEGDGEQILEDGDNEFEIYVYAENGFVRGYLINVTRRGDKITLAELTSELKETKEESVTVSLNDGDKLTKDMISAIAKWGKTLHLNKYDKDGKLLYGWTLIGKEVADMDKFESIDPTIKFDSKNADKIGELSNYASGFILDFAYSGKLPKNTVVTIPVGDEFEKDNVVYLYLYDEADNTLTQEGQPITVKGDTVELELSHCSTYLLTRANLAPQEKEEKKEEESGFSKREWILLIAIAAALIIIIVLIIFLVLKKKKRREESFSNRPITGLFDDDDDWDDDDDEYEITDLRR